jgi:hypothetical protein
MVGGELITKSVSRLACKKIPGTMSCSERSTGASPTLAGTMANRRFFKCTMSDNFPIIAWSRSLARIHAGLVQFKPVREHTVAFPISRWSWAR